MIKNQNFISLSFIIVMLLMSLLFFAVALTDLEPKAAATPILISSIVFVLSACVLFRELRTGYENNRTESESEASNNDSTSKQRPWWFMLILAVVYYILITLIGFFPATILFSLVVPYLLNYKNWKIIVLSSLFFILVYWVGFENLMNIRFPRGSLFS